MLCLQIAAPGHFIIKFIVGLFQKLNGLCIGNMGKLRVQHMVQPVQESLVNKGVEEVHLLRRILQHIADHIFQHSLCHLHIVLKICKSHLRLDHPELSRMAGSIGILCPECWTKGIDIPEGLCKGLSVELTADSQVGWLLKEIFGEIHLSFFCLWNIFQIHCSHLEHFSRSLTVAACDQWRMDIYKAPLLEKLMYGKSY